ncbi:MAG: hypothetical protein ABIO81_01270 [Ginsengibacter sp.]
MKFKFWLFPAMCVYCLLISATSIKVSPKYSEGESKYQTEIISGPNTVSPTKLNFFQRLMVRLFIKKYKKAYRDDISKADNLANISLIFGSAAMIFLVLGLFVPYIILAAIPAAIIAMITGGAALRKGTKYIGKAKTGKGFGLGVLIAFAVLVIVLAIVFSNSDWW